MGARGGAPVQGQAGQTGLRAQCELPGPGDTLRARTNYIFGSRQDESFLKEVVNVFINNTISRGSKDELLRVLYRTKCLNETFNGTNVLGKQEAKVVNNNTLSLEIEIKVEVEDRQSQTESQMNKTNTTGLPQSELRDTNRTELTQSKMNKTDVRDSGDLLTLASSVTENISIKSVGISEETQISVSTEQSTNSSKSTCIYNVPVSLEQKLSDLQILAVEAEEEDSTITWDITSTDQIDDSMGTDPSLNTSEVVTVVTGTDPTTTSATNITNVDIPSKIDISTKSGDQGNLSRMSLIQLLFLAFFVFVLGVLRFFFNFFSFLKSLLLQPCPAAPVSVSSVTGSGLSRRSSRLSEKLLPVRSSSQVMETSQKIIINLTNLIFQALILTRGRLKSCKLLLRRMNS